MVSNLIYDVEAAMTILHCMRELSWAMVERGVGKRSRNRGIFNDDGSQPQGVPS